jgi:branched-chain amino acid transport system permease protein
MEKRDKNRMIKWIFLPVIAILLLAGPWIVKDDYARHIIIMIFINVVLAEGLWVMRHAGAESFGQSAFAAIGGYCCAILSLQCNIDPWYTFLIGGVGAALISILLGLVIAHLSGVYFVICTFAFMELIRGLCINFVSLTGGAAGIPGIPAPSGLVAIFGSRTTGFYYLSLGVMVITLLAVLALTRSRLFLLFSAVDHNRALSSSVGIYVRKYKLMAFMFGCFFTGFAGAVLASYLTQIAPLNFGFLASLDIVLFCNIGGMGSVIGPAVGAIVMTYALFGLISIGYYKMIVYGAILAITVLVLRGGLISLPEIILNLFRRTLGKKGLSQN